MASRDDPFFEGIDLIGVSTNMKDLRKAVDAYRGVFDQRLQQRFNAKVLTLWPFGPQVFYCNKPIKSVNDIKGLKVRSFTPSMAALIQYLGGTPITLQFSEVYTVPAARRGRLRRDLAHVGQHRQVAGGYHALHAAFGVGLGPGPLHEPDYWKKFSPEQQQRLAAAFKKMEDQMWDLAERVNDDAVNCNVGKEPCKEGVKFKMQLVDVSPEDSNKIKTAVTAAVLPLWKQTCNKVDPKCTEVWNGTVGKTRGYKID